MPGPSNYPLDRAKLQEWANLQPEGTEYRSFAQTVARELVYVSWAEFRSALGACVDELMRTRPSPYCILLTGDESEPRVQVGKSQVWVALNLYSFLKQRGASVDDVVFSRAGLISWAKRRMLSGWDPRLPPSVLVVDDGAYTGQQLSTTLSKCFASDGERIENRRLKELDVVLVVPFMTDMARNLLATSASREWHPVILNAFSAAQPRLVILPCTRTIPVARFENKTYGLIYFDHKMADHISVGSLGIAAPVIKGRQNLCAPFIANCEETQCRNAIIFDAMELRHRGPGPVKRCPPPFYKSIAWTFDGRAISADDHLEDTLSAQHALPYACSNCGRRFQEGYVSRHAGSQVDHLYCSKPCVTGHCIHSES